MKNKVKFKKTITHCLIISVIILTISIIINISEYHSYSKNYNNKLSQIINYITSTNTNINENDLIKILNEEETNNYTLYKYGIDLKKDSAILKNVKTHNKYLIINFIFLSISLITLIYSFIKYTLDKDKELNNISKYIEEINNKNYSLKIDELSEDELSILKNEVYKVTILLKEQAENSKKDKLNLKKSLEDISHQLKTPLTSILIMLDSLIDNPNMKESQKQEYIISIKREIININFLVHSLLKLSNLILIL